MAEAQSSTTWEQCDREDLAAMIVIRDQVLAIRNRRTRENARRYKRENKELVAQMQREWRAANADRVRERQRGYGAKRRSKTKQGVGGAETRRWILKQKKVCHWCGKRCPADFHIDHIKPLARGGAHEFGNLCISCKSCNLSKRDRDPIEFAQSRGLLL